MAEGRKVVTVTASAGTLLVSADVHGNWDDFARLRQIFLDSEARGEKPVWLSVGDWVHGPSAERHDILGRDGAPLYDYPDRTPELLRALFSLMDQFPGRVLSLCGNHEHAHIGGPRTRKFHDDEAKVLEAQLSAAEVAELRARFRSWPIVFRVPSCALVITHGAMAPAFAHPDELEALRYDGSRDEVLASTMSWYGYSDGNDLALLERLSSDGERYELIVHGHDREEHGYAPSGTRGLLLCSSFGATRGRKAYLRLDLGRRYAGPGELREGEEIRFLWAPSAAKAASP
jgi:hypothetical protein